MEFVTTSMLLMFASLIWIQGFGLHGVKVLAIEEIWCHCHE